MSRLLASGWTVDTRWTSRGLKPYFNDFVVHKGHAYGFDGSILSSISLTDGERMWKGLVRNAEEMAAFRLARVKVVADGTR